MNTYEIVEYTLLLAVFFQLKHFIVDYLLQNTYMLGKFNKKGWLTPLLAHASMHGVATLIICLLLGVVNPVAIFIAFVDMFTHSVIDKAKVDTSRGLDPKTNKVFWWLLGGDQMLHHLTHYTLILLITSNLILYNGGL